MAEISNNPTAEGTNAWTNPSNGRTSNDSYATAAPGKNLSVSGIWKTFGITGSGTITKVEIGTEHKVSTTASIATLGRQISWDGGGTWGTEGILSTAETEVLVDTIYWYDVTAQTTWDWTKLNDTNLQTRIRAIQGNSSTAVTFSLDAIWVRVTYTPELAPCEAYATEAVLNYNLPVACEAYAAEAVLNYELPPCEVYAAEIVLNYVTPTEVYAAEIVLNYEVNPCEAYAVEAVLDYNVAGVVPCEVYTAEIVLTYTLEGEVAIASRWWWH